MQVLLNPNPHLHGLHPAPGGGRLDTAREHVNGLRVSGPLGCHQRLQVAQRKMQRVRLSQWRQ